MNCIIRNISFRFRRMDWFRISNWGVLHIDPYQKVARCTAAGSGSAKASAESDNEGL